MSSPSNFIATVDTTLAEKMKIDLEEQGFSFTFPQHTLFQAKKKGITCTLYKSGKLMVQGKEKDPFITFYLEPNILKTFTYSYPESNMDMFPHIGVDEAGKGDVFGPLCVGAVFATENQIKILLEYGICDSKKLSDKKISLLASKVKKLCLHRCVNIYPEKYNIMYAKFKNLNTLLAWAHATAIVDLHQQSHCKNVTIDQFAKEEVVEKALTNKGLSLNLTQKFKGEEDVVVAAASVIARDSFVQGIAKLEKSYNHTIPKGASYATVDAGKKFIACQGKQELHKIAKMHFKTVNEMTTH